MVATKRRPPRGLFEVQPLEPRRLLSAVPAISGDPSVHEGSLYTLNLASNDMDGEGVAFWTINWGDGNTQQFSGDPSTAQHIYNVNATTETITASVTENGSGYGGGYGDGYGGGYGDGYGDSYGGTYNSNSLSVDVLGNIPTATIGSISANPEADVVYNAVVFAGYDTSDSNNGTIQSVSVGWGDGTSTTYNASSYPGGVLPEPLPVTHSYSAGSGTYPYAVTATATDQYSSGLPDTIPVQVADASMAPVEVQTLAQYGSIEVDWLPGGSTPTGTTYSVYESTDTTMPTTPIASGLTGTTYTDTSSAAFVAGQKYHLWVEARTVAANAASPAPDTTIPEQAATGYHWITRNFLITPAVGGFIPGADPDGNPGIMTQNSRQYVAPWPGKTSANTYGDNTDFVMRDLGGQVFAYNDPNTSAEVILNTYYDTNWFHQLSDTVGQGVWDPHFYSPDTPFDTQTGNALQWSQFDLNAYTDGHGGDDSLPHSNAGAFTAGMAGVFTQRLLVQN